METIIREHTAAEKLGVSVRTLQRWRVQGVGPRFLKLGRKLVAYTEADLTAYLADCRRQSTSERPAA